MHNSLLKFGLVDHRAVQLVIDPASPETLTALDVVRSKSTPKTRASRRKLTPLPKTTVTRSGARTLPAIPVASIPALNVRGGFAGRKAREESLEVVEITDSDEDDFDAELDKLKEKMAAARKRTTKSKVLSTEKSGTRGTIPLEFKTTSTKATTTATKQPRTREQTLVNTTTTNATNTTTTPVRSTRSTRPVRGKAPIVVDISPTSSPKPSPNIIPRRRPKRGVKPKDAVVTELDELISESEDDEPLIVDKGSVQLKTKSFEAESEPIPETVIHVISDDDDDNDSELDRDSNTGEQEYKSPSSNLESRTTTIADTNHQQQQLQQPSPSLSPSLPIPGTPSTPRTPRTPSTQTRRGARPTTTGRRVVSLDEFPAIVRRTPSKGTPGSRSRGHIITPSAAPKTPTRGAAGNISNARFSGYGGAAPPPTPSTPTVYTLGKAIFQRGSHSSKVIGRTVERAIVEKFLDERLDSCTGGAMYVSGLPGTGKSALLNEVIEQKVEACKERNRKEREREERENEKGNEKDKKKKKKKNKNNYKGFQVKVVSINCMTIGVARDVFERIFEELNVAGNDTASESIQEEDREEDGVEEQQPQQLKESESQVDEHSLTIVDHLENIFVRAQTSTSGTHAAKQSTSTSTRHIIVLDELDHIMTKDQEVIFRIFQWAFAANSSLILFGIANALDLTDRFLPRLRGMSLIPQLLAFQPYGATEIAEIIEQRLRAVQHMVDVPPLSFKPTEEAALRKTMASGPLDPPPLMQLSAIQLCARKTASTTGDLRKAFDVCRRAIEVVEEEQRLRLAMHLQQLNSDDVVGSTAPETPGMARKRALLNLHSNSSTGTSGTGTSGSGAISEIDNNDNSAVSESASSTSASASASTTTTTSWGLLHTLETAPKATISHVAKVCSLAFGSGSGSGGISGSGNGNGNGMAQRIKSLNLQQKVVLCILCTLGSQAMTISISKMANNCKVTVTVMQVFSRYLDLCNRDKVLSPLSFADFLDVVSVLETLGVLTLGTSKNAVGSGSGKSVVVLANQLKEERLGTGSESGGELKRVLKGMPRGSTRTRGITSGGVKYGGGDISQRTVVTNIHKMDLMSSVAATPLLKLFMVET